MPAQTGPKSYSAAAKAAGLPVQISTEHLAEFASFTIISSEDGEARNPQTGEMGPIQLVTVEVEGERYISAIGGMVLQRDLKALREADQFPVTVQLVKSGRTWTFSDPD